MNFYAFHIGDYASATRHLSWDEDAAYRRLLDAYYVREAPLPLDKRKVYRLVCAVTDEQRGAVDTVLDEFFVKCEEGFRHARCDEEITKAQAQIEDADDRRANEAERQKRHREQRQKMFEQLREFGEVPAWNTSTTELKSLLDKHLSRVTVTEPVTPATSDSHNLQRLPNPIPNPIPNINTKDDKPSEPDGPALIPDDPKKRLFDLGVQVLTTHGEKESSARSFLAKHAKADESKLAEVLGYLAAHPKVEPKSYIVAALKPKERRAVW